MLKREELLRMMNKKFLFFAGMIFAVGVLCFIFVSAVSTFSGGSSTAFFGRTQYYQPSSFNSYYTSEQIGTYWPILANREDCEARQDLLLSIAPAGCQPAVVRSDLLAEQNVPVFCQVDALQINPLIDIKEIRNIRFTGDYPDEVIGVGYHPARAALRTRDKLLGSSLVSNIGYVVVVLKRTEREDDLSDEVHINLSAQLDYYSSNVFGVGRAEFILTPMDDKEWEMTKNEHGNFWNGDYHVRLDDVDDNTARVSIYSGDRRVGRVSVEKGKKSNPIYVPGTYCRMGIEVYYDGYVGNQDRATIEISDNDGTEVIDVYKGSRFLDNACTVVKLNTTLQSEEKKADEKEDGEADEKEDGEADEKEDGEADKKEKVFGGVEISCGSERFTLSRKLISEEGELGDKVWDGEVDAAFDEAITEYEKVAEDFGSERDVSVQGVEVETYGEKALKQAIDMAGRFEKYKTRARLIEKLLLKYPDNLGYVNQLNDMYSIVYSDSSYALNVGSKYRTIRLMSLGRAEQKPNAEFYIGRTRQIIKEAEKYEFDKGSFVLEKVNIGDVRVVEYCDTRKRTYTIKEGDSETICGEVVQLNNINIEKFAKIRLIPVSQGTEGETNLSVHIGIEKRAIELSPDKIKEKIENLNKSIEKFESIAESLGDVVKGMKTACYGTAVVLMAKNFITGISGEASARQDVMQVWKEKCADMISEGRYRSIDACYAASENKKLINEDIKIKTNAMKEVNDVLKEYEETGKTGFFGGKYVTNPDDAKIRLAEKIQGEYPNEKISELLKEDDKADSVSYSELRDIYVRLKIKGEGSENLQKSISAQLEQDVKRIGDNIKWNADFKKAQELTAKGFPEAVGIQTKRMRIIAMPVVEVGKISGENVGFGGEITHVARVLVPASVGFSAEVYQLGLIKSDNGLLSVKEVKKESDGVGVNDVLGFTKNYGIGNIKAVDSIECSHEFINPEVRFYETEPNKRMPALVPIDRKNGWYVATKQVLPVFGGIGAFDASGRVTSFWLCNVGEDGRADFFNGMDDDLCTMVNMNTGQTLKKISCLNEVQAERYISVGINAINDAAEQYGNKMIRIRTMTGNDMFESGSPAVSTPDVQCQDFMSITDCEILFNVCDPVICPSSRCNFGGEFPVPDVIQSGILGSTFLCLPNFKGLGGDVYIPVCLTGIHAGIEGLVSIMQAHRDCLQENLESGKMIGICDQIYSVYLCEFFWRQFAPAMNLLIPKLVEFAYRGGMPVGGGEYASVMSAWKNMENSVEYFTQSYAVNSLKAFKVRSTEEIGTEFCKAFISTRVPTDIDSLVEPDSPSQFHAWFTETTYSTTTLPATSHYKLFYHIFAGNDQGVYYNVYLKNPPESSYYSTQGTISVASGFIGKGEYNSETLDFTAPQGYKELCVRINQNEECGFKQVSSSAAIDYLSDSYVSNQMKETDIKTEGECISGSQSAEAFTINTNPMYAFEESVIPEIYNRGVVRICATENPGKSTEPARFVDVGYCDNQKIRCWLDKTSVENAISEYDKLLKNQTMSEIEGKQNQDLEAGGVYLGESNANEEIARLKDEKGKVDYKDKRIVAGFISKIEILFWKIYWNHQKAQVLMIKAEVKEGVAEEMRKEKEPVADVKGGVITEPEDGAVVLDKDGYYWKRDDDNGEGRWFFIGLDPSDGIKDYEKWKYFSDLEEPILYKGGGGVGEETRTEWTLDSAIEEIKTLKGSYSDNKEFINQLHIDEVLTDEEYNEINGLGILNLEEDMKDVKGVLLKKKLAEERAEDSEKI